MSQEKRLAGWRHVEVTESRSSYELDPVAEEIVLVMDNLKTHKLCKNKTEETVPIKFRSDRPLDVKRPTQYHTLRSTLEFVADENRAATRDRLSQIHHEIDSCTLRGQSGYRRGDLPASN